jgi:hypothetical protein
MRLRRCRPGRKAISASGRPRDSNRRAAHAAAGCGLPRGRTRRSRPDSACRSILARRAAPYARPRFELIMAQWCGLTMFSITVATRIWVGERRDGLLGLGDRHFLQQRDQVDDRGGRTEQAHDRVGLARIGRPGQSCQRLGTLRNREIRWLAARRAMTASQALGRCFMPRRPPRRPCRSTTRPAVLVRSRSQVDRTEAIQRLPCQAEVVERVQVFNNASSASIANPKIVPPSGVRSRAALLDRSAACYRRARGFCRPSTSQTSTRRPLVASAQASADAMVVLPCFPRR